jgi:hypothetical protein
MDAEAGGSDDPPKGIDKGVAGGLARTGARYLRRALQVLDRVKLREFRLPKFKLRWPEKLPKIEFHARWPERLPKIEFRVQPRTVSRSAEQLRSAMELRENYVDISEERMREQRPSKPPVQTPLPHTQAIERRSWRVLAADGAHAMPGFLRSVALTTLIFSFYEESMERLVGNSMTVRSDMLLAPFGIGLIGGCGHGLLYNGSDYLFNKVRGMPIGDQYFGAWTALSHSLVYGSLFGCYESAKFVLFKGFHIEDRNKLSAGVCVSCAGAVSGYASEVINHFTKQLEHGKLRAGIAEMRALRRPSVTSCIPGIITSTFGFLAYEYALDLRGSHPHKHNN